MADEVLAPAPVVEAAPVVAQPEVVPVVAPVEVTPSETAAPVTASPVVTEAPVEAKPLLSADEPKAEVKSDATVTETAPEVKTEVAPLPVYEFKLPEGAQTDSESFKAFQSKLGEFQNLSKSEQAAVQKFGQEMIDLHVAELKSLTENANKASWDWFNNRNKEWLENSKKDPVIGGDNFDKTISSAQSAISLYGGNKAQQLEIAKMFQETGVENHPALLRFLSNITRTAAKEGTPVSSQSAPTQKPGIAQAMYGNMSR